MCPNPKETEDLATFTEEILDGKFNFLCGASKMKVQSATLWYSHVDYKNLGIKI